MGFTPKNWEDSPAVTTPLSAAAIEDVEIRVTDHADIRGASTSVMDPVFEVTGDGATDDTVGFESARTAAGVGGHVYVPPNTYVLNDADLTLDGQTWTFAPGAVIKLKDSAGGNGAAVVVSGDYVTIYGGEWDGNRSNNSTANTGLITISGGSHCRVTGIYLHDAQAHGVKAFPAAVGTALDDVEVSGSTFIDCVGQGVKFDFGAAGAPVVPSRGARIISCYSDNSNVPAASVVGGGFQIYGHTSTLANKPRGCVIADCVARSRVDGVTDVAGAILDQVNGGSISGCHTESMSFQGYGVISSADVAVIGCSDYGSDSYGIELAGVSGELVGASVSGCYLSGNAATTTGIAVNTALDVSVSGNVIRDLKDAANSGGISVLNPGSVAGTGRVTITGNQIFTTYQGIYNADDLATDILIADNNVQGDASASAPATFGLLFDPGTSSSKRWTVRGNVISDVEYGIRIRNGLTLSDVTIRANTFLTIGTTRISLTGSFDNTCTVVDDTEVGSVASGATVTLPFNETVTISGTADITSITASYPGRVVRLIFSGTAATNGLVDGSNLKLASTLAYTPDDTITLVCDGTNWTETGRSVN